MPQAVGGLDHRVLRQQTVVIPDEPGVERGPIGRNDQRQKQKRPEEIRRPTRCDGATARREAEGAKEIRNPKAEGAKEIRNPKAEGRWRLRSTAFLGCGFAAFRSSSLCGFISHPNSCAARFGSCSAVLRLVPQLAHRPALWFRPPPPAALLRPDSIHAVGGRRRIRERHPLPVARDSGGRGRPVRHWLRQAGQVRVVETINRPVCRPE